MMNDTLNIKRLINLFRFNLASERRFIIQLFLAFLAINLLVISYFGYFSYLLGSRIGTDFDAIYNNVSINLCQLFYCVVIFVGSSLLFRNMNKMPSRINFLMTPSSNFEKYLLRWVEVVVIGSILYFAAFVIADAIRYLVQPVITGQECDWLTPNLFCDDNNVPDSQITELSKTKNVSSVGYNIGYKIGYFAHRYDDARGAFRDINSWAFLFYVQSLFQLCGTLFRKRAWMYATLCSLVVFLLTCLLPYGMAVVELVCYIVFFIFNYIASYYLFCNIQVINNKLTNL